ncbi:YicC family protein [Clostridium swellfunianum]|uniref:YicC/YloC family endoribonuclease n=1 Tax=Clostridium swellfunianum TaxID=1367462 RepID=UPI00202EDB38|nr:YicC/YloC family endoribonuclease [Clostridium swellfunianum]MCM0648736.1 YicC family protein [Clostridium swellfunianum]
MTNSMTGFGRGSTEENGRSFIVEIKSVNHRYLDLNIKMPRNLASLEDRIRRALSEKINRGKIDVYVTQNIIASNDVAANFNYALADSYIKCLKEIKDRYEVRDDISVSLISRFPDVITLNQKEEDIETLWNIISVSLNAAIDMLVSMRQKEGLKLKEDILSRCNYINNHIAKIVERAPVLLVEYKEKLEKRVKELLNDAKLDEGRMAMEIAIFADKSNIDEEIVRLNSHIVQMKDTLELAEPIGRKLDFIIQEMNREANTIASKANDLELTNIVLNIKNEIEKIREQVQNVE